MRQRPDVPWIPIRYGGFYDVPLMVLLTRGGRMYLLDRPFEEDKDEYSDYYIAYRLPPDLAERVDSIVDWTELLAVGKRLGTIPIASIQFDETNRKAIADRGLDLLGP